MHDAWRVAFEAADARRTNGGQDFFLGMNAHIQRDLPMVIYRMGLVGAEAPPSPLDETAALETIKAWREGAWRNAERLAAAASETELDLVMTSIETEAEAWSRLIALADNSPYASFRTEYCRSAHR